MILLLSDLPLSIKMVMEKIHTKEMYNRYEIDVLSHSYPPPAQINIKCCFQKKNPFCLLGHDDLTLAETDFFLFIYA